MARSGRWVGAAHSSASVVGAYLCGSSCGAATNRSCSSYVPSSRAWAARPYGVGRLARRRSWSLSVHRFATIAAEGAFVATDRCRAVRRQRRAAALAGCTHLKRWSRRGSSDRDHRGKLVGSSLVSFSLLGRDVSAGSRPCLDRCAAPLPRSRMSLASSRLRASSTRCAVNHRNGVVPVSSTNRRANVRAE